MDLGADPGIRQVLLQGVPRRIAYYEQVPHRLRPLGHEGQSKSGEVVESFQVSGGHRPAAPVPVVQFVQLHPAKGHLQLVQTRVKPYDLMSVLHALSVVA